MRRLFLGILFVLIGFSVGFAQSIELLNEILDPAEKQTINFQETFNNLLAVETKTFENYDKKEKLKNKSIVESNFFVYRSSKNPKLSFELRNVLRVNGRDIPGSKEKADEFFAELGKTKTLKSELDKIQKAGSKYDKNFDVNGLTLYEGIVLAANIRPSLEFELRGREILDGIEVFAIGYKQIKSSPFISINGKPSDFENPSLEFSVNHPREFKKEGIFLRGTLWIDVKTHQIRGEERELAAGTAVPIVLLRMTFNYQDSNYGILVPKQISVVSNRIVKKDGKFQSQKETSITFDYSAFRRTETDVQILDDPDDK